MVSKNPLKSLLNSRKFWVMILDLVTSFTLYFVAKYAKIALEDVKFVILGLQPLFLLVIYSIYGQNVQGMKSDSDVESSKTYYLSESKMDDINKILKEWKSEKGEKTDSLKLPKSLE